MSLIQDNGYLNGPYLGRESYLGADALNAQDFQVLRVIDGSRATLFQTNFVVNQDPLPRFFQVLRQITGPRGALVQVLRRVNEFTKGIHWQIQKNPSKPKTVNTSTKLGRILHTINADDFYLAGPYLMDGYLSKGMIVWPSFQVKRDLTKQDPMLFQVERVIYDVPRPKLFNVERVITKELEYGFQVNRIQRREILWQVNRILYNTKKLRVLLDFPSRGITGNNWTASSTASGDFSALNLNTDIVEQCWRSNGSKIVALTCDTQVSQGVFVDTVAILGHNLTRSATVEIKASNDPGFATYESIVMETNRTSNWYYIAPKAPTTSYRYWRFQIGDSTNAADYLQIGSIVFGSSIIMVANDITDSVRRSTKHFSDKVQTEGFTNVSNDRAIKSGLGVEFRSIAYDVQDYTSLRRVFDTARTSIKCLWIPTPEYPERFAVFGKLSTIPEESHMSLGPKEDYVSFNVDVDESL